MPTLEELEAIIKIVGLQVPDEIRAHPACLQRVLEFVDCMPLGRPVAPDACRLTSRFGYRIDPFTKTSTAYHSGVDLAGEEGTPISATAPGFVTCAEERGPYGLLIEIDHGSGFQTRYGHLIVSLTKRLWRAERGEQIGLMGSTGRSTGPHLHYEVWFNGIVRDPEQFMAAGDHFRSIDFNPARASA